MKNTIKLSIILLSLLLVGTSDAWAKDKKKKEKDPYKFTIEVENDRLSTKNQGRSSTCWSFSGTSFLESEIMRMGKEPVELSIMYTVKNTYLEKADRYSRWHGKIEFGPGGAFHDVTHSFKKYGIVPMEVFPGNKAGTNGVNHGEMDAVLSGFMNGLKKSGKPSPVWKDGFNALVSNYLGETPEEFSYKGQVYTPQSFAVSLGLNLDDYVELSSFTHHPFYEKFVLEVPDNWLRDEVYNLPLDEFLTVMKEAIRGGYTVAWAADLDKGFNFAKGLGVVTPDNWDGKTFEPGMEPHICQTRRQREFDNYSTTDDHGMHFVGLAKDKKGGIYFLEKNSWGEGNKYKGYSYVSEEYVRLKTTCIMVNKNAIPQEIRAKLGL